MHASMRACDLALSHVCGQNSAQQLRYDQLFIFDAKTNNYRVLNYVMVEERVGGRMAGSRGEGRKEGGKEGRRDREEGKKWEGEEGKRGGREGGEEEGTG
jgi:hypothetical protein